MDQRLPASLALAVLAAERGASHDKNTRCTAATADAVAMVTGAEGIGAVNCMSRRYFGTDGIRGSVGGRTRSHPDFMLKLGWACGRVFPHDSAGAVRALHGDYRQGHPGIRLYVRVGPGGRAWWRPASM